MALAVALIILVLGSLLFHFLSPWYFTPLASNWGSIDFTVDITFVVTGLVFVAANLFHGAVASSVSATARGTGRSTIRRTPGSNGG